jgi:spore germination protein YaaH
MGSEDAASIPAKIGLAKRYGLKGVAIWRIGLIGQAAFEQMSKSITMRKQ